MQGIQPQELTIQELSTNQLVKCWKGNDIWELVMVHHQPVESDRPIPQEVTDLLQQYPNVFADPKGLPPSRVYDHTIPLPPNVVPVNSRPYRHPPHNKDEIERQVREMIQAGFVVPSTSPFCLTGIACPEERWQLEVLC